MSRGATRELPVDDSPEAVGSALYAEYCRRHPGTSFAAFAHIVRQGVVWWAELDLEAVHRSAGYPSEAARPACLTAQLQQLLDRLCSLVALDPLTGLFNRRYLDHRIRQELRRSKREQRPCSLLVVDADDFKRINDTYGHSVGDAVLRRVATVLRRSMRASDDVSARFGGEEFVVLLPSTPAAGALGAAHRLRREVQAAVTPAPRGPIEITVSIGMATFDPREEIPTVEQFLGQADEALYAAKAAGKNTVKVHKPEASGLDAVSLEEKDALLR
ncbi:MAG: GGDEF domain-containing protein [Proteobacteria bacterium]|nr:GGDEF domain-containing protein [Pseudomonadota bacterium]